MAFLPMEVDELASMLPEDSPLAVTLSGVDAAILERRPPSATGQSLPSPAERFAALVAVLEGATARRTAMELVALLCAVAPRAPAAVRRAHGARSCRVLTTVWRAHGCAFADEAALGDGAGAGDGDDDDLEARVEGMACRVLGALGAILSAADRTDAAWKAPALQRPLRLLLVSLGDGRPAVAKTARRAVLSVLRNQQRAGVAGAGGAAGHTAAFLASALAGVAAADAAAAASAAGLAGDALPMLAEGAAARGVVEALLRLPSLGSPVLAAAALTALKKYAEAETCPCEDTLTRCVVPALAGMKPSASADPAVATLWCELGATCALRACADAARTPHGAATAAADAASACLVVCEADSLEAARAAGAALSVLVGGALGAQRDKPPVLDAVLDALATGPLLQALHFRYRRSWRTALPALSQAFAAAGVTGRALRPSVATLLGALVAVRDTLDTDNAALGVDDEEDNAAAAGYASAFKAGGSGAALAATSECIGLAVQRLGPAAFMSAVPLAPRAEAFAGAAAGPLAAAVVNDKRGWVVPLLRKRLRFSAECALKHFTDEPLAIAKACNARARECQAVADKAAALAKASDGGAGNVARLLRVRVVQLWSLFPAYCAAPADAEAALPPLLGVITAALTDPAYPELAAIVCGGLRALADAPEEAVSAALKEKIATRFMPSLFSAYQAAVAVPEADASGGAAAAAEAAEAAAAAAPKAHTLSQTVAALAARAPPAFVSSLFKNLMQRLLGASASSASATAGEQAAAASMCSLAVALAPSLDAKGATLLYRAAKPLLADGASSAVQKRAYRVLLALWASQPATIVGEKGAADADVKAQLMDVFQALKDSAVTCHVGSRQLRLRCIGALAAELRALAKKGRAAAYAAMDDSDGGDSDCDTAGGSAAAAAAAAAAVGGAEGAALRSLLGEVIACVKDSNRKTREAAFGALISMARARGDPCGFLTDVAAALASETPHMRSAAVMALARLVFQFGRDYDVKTLLPRLLQAVLVLFDEPSKEVAAACVGFIRVAVPASDAADLEPLLDGITKALLEKLDDRLRKGKCRARVKLIFKRLCRIFTHRRVLEGATAYSDKALIEYAQRRAVRHERRMERRALADADAEAMDGSGDFSGDDEDDSGMSGSDSDGDGDDGDFDDGGSVFSDATGISGWLSIATSRRSGKSRRSGRSTMSFAAQSVALSTNSAMPLSDKMRVGLKAARSERDAISVARKSARALSSRGGGGRKRGRDADEGGGRVLSEVGKEGEVVDLLDGSMMANLDGGRGGKKVRFSSGVAGSGLAFSDGRLVVADDAPKVSEDAAVQVHDLEDDDDDLNDAPAARKRRRAAAAAREEARDVQDEATAKKRRDGGRAALAVKPPVTKKIKHRAPGAEFKAKGNTGGDVHRGGLEPFAYLPLDPRMLASGRSEREAVAHFGQVVSRGKMSAGADHEGKGSGRGAAGKGKKAGRRSRR